VHAGLAITFAGTTVIGGEVGYTSADTGGPLTNGVQNNFTVDLVALKASMQEVWAAGMATRINTTTIPSPGIGDPAFPGDSIFTAGTWNASTISIAAAKTVTLDAQGNPDAVFLFQAATTMLVGAGFKIILINGAKAENVVWAIGTALTLGAGSHFQGSILAGTAVTIGADTVVEGSVMAGAALGIGANSIVDGSVIAGSAITFGAITEVHGSVVAITAITFGAGSSVVVPNATGAVRRRLRGGSSVKR
jgi:hypothetical protein